MIAIMHNLPQKPLNTLSPSAIVKEIEFKWLAKSNSFFPKWLEQEEQTHSKSFSWFHISIETVK